MSFTEPNVVHKIIFVMDFIISLFWSLVFSPIFVIFVLNYVET